ncbi:N-acetyllactosaminide beta-1,3-N-acetylglucosaminyltransferase 2-like isoform X2 [Hyla sarda]|nr:N-acetyllactosaminide beta-1,3-N-acetylglucosaminyltransferase 2-like isoform X2 [Hyla sarda]XP_056393775.1 N-acetyllactosaminide beta-1,3-N-acetylglucosaminyltransferase 2-like isoform X2 [Hyla sarda]XP_056393776.1 N-acetyllactosaminide beta-1,3-N-acetylglucosaminyltransferase 2-like isoform X2 [Hyla sarda]
MQHSAMVRCRKFSISVIALLSLLVTKIFIDFTYTPLKLSEPSSISPGPDRNPLTMLEPLQDDEKSSLAALHSLAQSLKKLVPAAGSYWNMEQHQLLDLKRPWAWNCSKPTPQINPPEPYSELLLTFRTQDQCRNHRMIISQPDKCPHNRTFLLLAIKSSPQNFAQRQAVRGTWGAEKMYGGKHVRLVFLLGTMPMLDLSPLLEYENSQSHDLLQWDFADTFFNLTLKDQLFLGWARTYCAKATYILKGDDDVFVRTPNLVHVLTLLSSHRHHPLYMGHVVKLAKPYRDPKSKYYIPTSFYMGMYPPYAGGGGYVFSGSLTPWLYLVSHFVFPFPIDDVYTGMCFMALGVRPVGHPGFKTFNTPKKEQSSTCLEKNLLLVHQKSPKELLKMWGEDLEPTQQCS